MKDDLKHEVLILAFGELSDDEWESAVEREERQLQSALNDDKNRWVGGTAKAVDIGRGADWLVLGMYFVLAGLAIPEAHKKVRENLEEWRRIYSELHQLFSRIVGKRRALYPDAYLFLVALDHLQKKCTEIGCIEFKGLCRLPESNPDLAERESLLFTFGVQDHLFQVAVARNGVVLWDNQLSL